jgi:hypothetical protein
MNTTKVASRRISRSWAMWPLSVRRNLVNVQDHRISTPSSLTKRKETSTESCDGRGVTSLAHDSIYNRNLEASQNGRQSSHLDVGYSSDTIIISNILKVEVASKSCQISSELEKKVR